jgi:hypothetical protein
MHSCQAEMRKGNNDAKNHQRIIQILLYHSREISNHGTRRNGYYALSSTIVRILLSQKYTDCDLSDEQKERRPSAN